MVFIFTCCFPNDLTEEIHTDCGNIEAEDVLIKAPVECNAKNLCQEKLCFTNELVEKAESTRGLTIFRNKRKTHRYKPY